MTSCYPVIFAVDDDETDLFLLHRALNKMNLAQGLVTARDGQQAIEYLSGNRAEFPLPQLMLLDIKMPCVNGFEVLEWMQGRREELRAVPVVMLSSSNVPEDKTRALEAGACDYKVKPNALEDLVVLVQELSQRWLGGRMQPVG